MNTINEMDIVEAENTITPNATEDVTVSSQVTPNNAIVTEEYYNETVEAIKKMNYIEASRALRDLLAEIANFKQAKEMISQIETFASSGIEKTIQEANALSQLGKDGDIESFNASYDDTIERLESLVKLAEDNVRQYDGLEKTTTVLTNMMLEIIQSRLVSIQEKGFASNSQQSIYYRTVQDVFMHRSNCEYFVKKITSERVSLQRLQRETKKDPASKAKTQKFITSTLITIFDAEQLARVETYINELFKNDEVVFYFLYMLASIYNNVKVHKKTGEHKWVEVLIMNILDIQVGIYDLEGGAEEYANQLLTIYFTLRYILTPSKLM